MNTNNGHSTNVSDRPSVLIVEDSPPQALKTKLALESSGCQVTWADTGLGGLDMARQDTFDLIVLDIELPDINGFEVCRNLKTDPKLADIPIVMLTTLDQAGDAVTGLEAGAVNYIPKDVFADAILVETIRQMKVGAKQ